MIGFAQLCAYHTCEQENSHQRGGECSGRIISQFKAARVGRWLVVGGVRERKHGGVQDTVGGEYSANMGKLKIRI